MGRNVADVIPYTKPHSHERRVQVQIFNVADVQCWTAIIETRYFPAQSTTESSSSPRVSPSVPKVPWGTLVLHRVSLHHIRRLGYTYTVSRILSHCLGYPDTHTLGPGIQLIIIMRLAGGYTRLSSCPRLSAISSISYNRLLSTRRSPGRSTLGGDLVGV